MKFMDTSEDESAKIHIFGVPFDSTSSFRSGSRFAPDEIRKFSYNLESYSPVLKKNLFDCDFIDRGDLELPFGNPSRAISEIADFTEKILSKNAIPFALGGEHLITYGTFRAVTKKYPDVRLIQFDAHADLRDKYLGEKLSHATVIRRCAELCGFENLIQIGVRSGTEEEWKTMEEIGSLTKTPDKFSKKISKTNNIPIYLTVDLDILDPSVFPGTGTPEPGGLTYNELMAYLYKLRDLNIVGLDVVELSPPYDPSGISAAVASKIVRELLLIIS